ncbi:MAG: AsmA 2 protein [Candidatus Brocadiaceae bacterium]|nr:AsmA 2 protein [Candidatus Brocadiaceae bacterium]
MHMRLNKMAWIKGLLIYGGITVCLALTAILVIIPAYVSEDFVKEKVTGELEGKSYHVTKLEGLSFHWPGNVHISSLVVQNQDRPTNDPIQFEDVSISVKALPLLFKNFVAKNISIRKINYENQFLIQDLVTSKFSFKKNMLSIQAQFLLNEGATSIEGNVDVSQGSPIFDLSLTARDVHITQDVPFLCLLPMFAVKDGELAGMLSLSGSIRGSGTGKEMLNNTLVANLALTVKDGYVKGNKLISSLLDIMGTKKTYSFDLMEASIEIKDGKINTPKVTMSGQMMSLTGSGTAAFDGTISYDATIRFNKEYLSKDMEKISKMALSNNELPVEIRGTAKSPKVAIVLYKDNLEQLVKGLISDFTKDSKKKTKK